jgi:hypothetical protein
MKLNRKPTVSRALLAVGLLVTFAAAQAAPGYTVTAAQQSQIKPGMSQSDVQSALGRPAAQTTFNNEPGATLTYRVAGATDTLFDVNLDASGRVASVDTRGADVGGNI